MGIAMRRMAVKTLLLSCRSYLLYLSHLSCLLPLLLTQTHAHAGAKKKKSKKAEEEEVQASKSESVADRRAGILNKCAYLSAVEYQEGQAGVIITVEVNTPNPTNPTKPTNPTNPTNPIKPVNPTNPTKSTNPLGAAWGQASLDGRLGGAGCQR
jgi:hypothetical protein